MPRQFRPQNLIHPHQLSDIYKELYGRSGPIPRLTQVVKDKYYHRWDSTPIRCFGCGKKLVPSERINSLCRCDNCTKAIWENYQIPKPTGPAYIYPESWRPFDGTYG